MKKRLTTAEFVEKATEKHNGKYDYSETEYIQSHLKVKIICPIHGVFEQCPDAHMKGCGCGGCGIEKRTSNKEKFIEKAKMIHGNKYGYSEVKYINTKTKVKIICPIHGIFEQEVNNHLNGQGCRKCGYEKLPLSTTEFVENAKKIHGNKYDYSLVEYVKSILKVKIICPIHGIFEQTPNAHLRGDGCRKCAGLAKLSTSEFIEKAKMIHGNKYGYSEVKYINTKTKVKIICPIHGIFEQIPNAHLNGRGCRKCKSSRGEDKVMRFLEAHKIEYEKEKTFPDCKSKIRLRFDFYIPVLNTLIEFDGIQHFPEQYKKYFNGRNFRLHDFQEIQSQDSYKNFYAEVKGIDLIRIKYNENVEDKLRLLPELYNLVKDI